MKPVSAAHSLQFMSTEAKVTLSAGILMIDSASEPLRDQMYTVSFATVHRYDDVSLTFMLSIGPLCGYSYLYK